MILYRKVQAVEKLFRQLEKDVATFQQATTMKCKSACGLCCMKPDIAASPLEFLPLAYHLHKNGKANEMYEQLKESDQKICMNLNAFLSEQAGGFCSNYAHRGLICRLFGFSAMIGKNHKRQLVTCKTIKTEMPESFARAEAHIASNRSTPVISNYYYQLKSIDQDMGNSMLPINQAMLEALKIVLSYYAYRHPRKAG